jgi:RNA polymerase sigma-54 factor
MVVHPCGIKAGHLMALELKQAPKLVQQLVITPQLQQAIRLLQLTRLELVDLIRQEMKENPMLEESEEGREYSEAEETVTEKIEGESIPESQKTQEVKGEGEGAADFDWENYLENYNHGSYAKQSSQDSEERPSFENFLTKRTTLSDHLNWQLQLSHFTDEEQKIGWWIIGNLDEDGYLKISLEDISSETQLPLEMVESVLRRMQQFDPVGVAARDLKECLLVQLEQLPVRDPVAEDRLRVSPASEEPESSSHRETLGDSSGASESSSSNHLQARPKTRQGLRWGRSPRDHPGCLCL